MTLWQIKDEPSSASNPWLHIAHTPEVDNRQDRSFSGSSGLANPYSTINPLSDSLSATPKRDDHYTRTVASSGSVFQTAMASTIVFVPEGGDSDNEGGYATIATSQPTSQAPDTQGLQSATINVDTRAPPSADDEEDCGYAKLKTALDMPSSDSPTYAAVDQAKLTSGTGSPGTSKTTKDTDSAPGYAAILLSPPTSDQRSESPAYAVVDHPSSAQAATLPAGTRRSLVLRDPNDPRYAMPLRRVHSERTTAGTKKDETEMSRSRSVKVKPMAASEGTQTVVHDPDDPRYAIPFKRSNSARESSSKKDVQEAEVKRSKSARVKKSQTNPVVRDPRDPRYAIPLSRNQPASSDKEGTTQPNSAGDTRVATLPRVNVDGLEPMSKVNGSKHPPKSKPPLAPKPNLDLVKQQLAGKRQVSASGARSYASWAPSSEAGSQTLDDIDETSDFKRRSWAVSIPSNAAARTESPEYATVGMQTQKKSSPETEDPSYAVSPVAFTKIHSGSNALDSSAEANFDKERLKSASELENSASAAVQII